MLFIRGKGNKKSLLTDEKNKKSASVQGRCPSLNMGVLGSAFKYMLYRIKEPCKEADIFSNDVGGAVQLLARFNRKVVIGN